MGLPVVAIGDIVRLNRTMTNPSQMDEVSVHHFSLPAFDDGATPAVVPAASIKSNKTRIVNDSVLVSRLNPRIDRTWWVSPDADMAALASTEFACLEATDSVKLAAVWLAVRDPAFRAELVTRVTGTSGSHQRVRPDDLLAIEVMDVRGLAEETIAQVLALLTFVDQARVESRALATVRHVLLPELLSGRLRVRDSSQSVERHENEEVR